MRIVLIKVILAWRWQAKRSLLAGVCDGITCRKGKTEELKSAVTRVSPSRKQVAPSRPLNGDEMKWTVEHLLI